MADVDPAALTAEEFRRRYARGGYAWTMNVSYAIGAHFALAALRRGISPNAISYAGATVAVLSSLLVVALLGMSHVLAAVVAFVGWQLAYALDCTDGQVARARGGGTPVGAVIDLSNDWVSRVSVLAAVMAAVGPGWLGPWTGTATAVIAGLWLFGLAYEGWTKTLGSEFSRAGVSWLVDAVRNARDYGFQIALLPAGLAFGSQGALLAILALCALEGVFIATRLVAMARG